MLLRFSVENEACFAGKVTLDLGATSGDRVDEVPGAGPVHRAVALYGPNASGRTSFLRAFRTLRRLALSGVAPGGELPVRPHRLDPALRDAPTALEVEFAAGGVRYGYRLRADRRRVLEESLVRDGIPAFVREAGRIEIGAALPLSEERRRFHAFVAEGTRPEQPLLAELRARNATELQPAWVFFDRTLVARPDEPRSPTWLEELEGAPELLDDVARLLREAGVGVESIRVDRLEAEFLHRGAAGPVALRYAELSSGTRRLLDLAHDSLVAPRLLIDDLDRSLLPAIAWLDRPGVQRIYATRDPSLLAAFAPDAVWTLEKGSDGASRLVRGVG